MVKLPEDTIPQIYARFMEEIKIRLEATTKALNDAHDKKGQANAFMFAEFAYLQVRRVTELIALSVLVAHNEIEDFRTKRFIKEWDPKTIFARLAHVSDTAFPEPFRVGDTDANGVAEIFINTDGHLTKPGLATIHHKCSEQLHAGTLKSLIHGKSYDIGEIQGWSREISKLLDHHVVMLPEMKRTMIVFMAKHPDGKVSCALTNLVRKLPLGTPPPNPPSFLDKRT